MTRADILAKLEKIASEGGSIAELNACKALLALPEYAEADAASQDPFAKLDNVKPIRGRGRRAA